MKTLLDYLEQLGLSEIEAKLYLRLLEDGSIGVRELAKRVGINRTSAYVYIDQLIEKGVIIKIVKGTRNQVAANPLKETLPQLLEKKAQTVKNLQNELQDMIKTIPTPTHQGKDSDEAEIKYYKGKLGIKKIYQQALQAKELRSYVNIKEVLEIFPENAQLFNDAFKQNPEIKMFEICEDSPQARERIKASNKNHLYKILPTDMKLTGQDVLLYDNKVAVIHLKDKINGVILHNTDLFYNFKLLFDFLWKMIL